MSHFFLNLVGKVKGEVTQKAYGTFCYQIIIADHRQSKAFKTFLTSFLNSDRLSVIVN